MVKKEITVTQGMVRAEFNFWVGKYVDKFYDGLMEKKIVGNKCAGCGKVYVPPRKVCGACSRDIPLESTVDLPDTGTLLNYTLTPYWVSERNTKKKRKPSLVGLVKIDGSDSALIYKILGAEEGDLETGMKVKAEWNKRLKGEPGDIKGFKPAGGDQGGA
ncbi:MAG: Zn-ribbon domain-containing OB-fold protein [Promethearchaeota archaeon]